MANTVKITARTDDKASGPLDNIRDKFDKMKAQGAKGFGLGVGAAAGTIAFNALGNAIGGVTDFLGDSIAKAREEEVGILRLGTALKANIAGYDGNTDAIERVIKEREKLAFSDGEQRDALALLVARTHDVTKALDLERQAMDLSRLTGKDLATSSQIIGKVYGGNVAILKRFGIQVSDGADSVQALAEIQKAAAGQAEAYGASSAGAAESAKIAFDDLQEEIGQKATPALTKLSVAVRDDVIPALSTAIDILGEAGDGVEVLTSQLEKFTFAGALTPDIGHGIRTLPREAGLAATALNKTGKAAKITEGDVDDMGDTVDDAATSFKNMRSAIRDAGKALGDQKFGHQELSLKIKGENLDLKDNTDKLHQLEAIKNPTRAQREDIIATKLAIIDNKQALIGYKAELAATGKVNMSITDSWLKRVADDATEAGDAAKYARNQLLSIPGAKPSGGGGGGGGKKGGFSIGGSAPSPGHPGGGGAATGGYRGPGWSGKVGELGEEGLHLLPGGGAYITPNKGGGGGGGLTINVMGVSVLTPGSAEALARQIGPHVTRWQQQRGL